MTWAEAMPSLVGTLIGGVLTLAGTFMAWALARRAELRDRPRRELVPLASRLLAAVQVAYGAEQERHVAAFSLAQAQSQPQPNAEAISGYISMWEDAMREARAGMLEAQTASNEFSLLYPGLAPAAENLIKSVHMRSGPMRSEEEEARYLAARDDLMDRVRTAARVATPGPGSARATPET